MSSAPARSHSPKGRKFYTKATFKNNKANEGVDKASGKILANSVRDNIVGNKATFSGPFGNRRVIYCDHVASGRAVRFIEDFIQKQVLPLYGNTHTTTTISALQTTHFRDEARDIIRNAVNASEEDAVIFQGSGATGAVHKLVQALKPRIETSRRTVVLASLMEHHSTLLPWRDLGLEVETIPEEPSGRLDADWLEKQLQSIRREEARNGLSPALIIGIICAASNITGILNDDIGLTAILHSHGALALWDYATAAPYVHVDVNPIKKGAEVDPALTAKDAVFFSAHKFVGGVQAPGVLVAKKRLFANPVPNGGGGGSVFFVNPESHRYLKDVETREEGGTPAIVESIRAGLAMQLKEAVGSDYIMTREEILWSEAKERLKECPNLVLLGSQELPRLPVLSFVVKHGASGMLLHHNFVCAVLNDVFGIQARGGCACAGPYAQTLLGINSALADDYESVLAEDDRLDRHHLRRGHAEYSAYEVFRPGFSRLSLPWYSSDEEIDFILRAVEIVAEHGWKLLPQYRLNNETGEWKHHSNLEYQERKWLGNISYGADGTFNFSDKYALDLSDEEDHVVYSRILAEAEEVLSGAQKEASRQHIPDQRLAFDGEEDVKRLRWFMLPSEAKEYFGQQTQICTTSRRAPFEPKAYGNLNQEEVFVIGSYSSLGESAPVSEPLRRALEATKGQKLNGSPWLEHHPAKSQEMNNSETGNEQTALKTEKEQRLSSEDNVALPVSSSSKNVEEVNNGECVDNVCIPVQKEQRQPLPVQPDSQNLAKWKSPPKEIFRPFLEAVKDFNMIKDGDRVLVCLSGGKDSLSLLHILHQYQYVSASASNVHFSLGAVTVDPGSSAYDPRPLIPYLKSLGVPYLYEEQDIMEQALKADCSSICAFCSRMKRGRIYAAARRENYNVLAMGQHLDDLAESFLMSVFHNGRIRTMKANYSVREDDLRLIRPLCYVRESSLRSFAQSRRLPVIAENCPACFAAPKERHRTKQLLAQQELLFPRLYTSLRSAMLPAMSVNRTGMEKVLFGKGALNLSGDQNDDQDDEDDVTM